MAEARTIIPVNKQFQEMIVNGMDTLTNFVGNMLKLQNREYELKKQQEQREGQLQRMQIASREKYGKLREKLTLTYFKEFVKGKFFSRIRDVLGKIASSATSWFFSMLKALLVLAIFDPKGKFLGSIINFITKMVVWFVKTLTRYIPQIIKTIIYLVTEVIPPLLQTAIKEIFSALTNMFYTWADQLPEDSVLGKILRLIGDAFGENGILTIFFTKMAGFFPIIFAGLGIIAGLTKLMPVFNVLWKIGSFIIPKLITGITALFSALKSLTLFLIANPIVAVIAGIIIAFIAILKWGDKIQAWLNQTFGENSILAKSFNVLNVIVKEIWQYIKTLWQNIKIFFQEIQEIGVMQAIGNLMKRSLKAIGNALSNIIPAIAGMIGSMMNKIFNVKIFSGLEQKVKQMMQGIKDVFNSIIDWFKTIGRVGVMNYVTGSEQEKQSWKDLTKLQSQLERKREMGLQLSDAEKGLLYARDEDFKSLAEKFEGTDVAKTMYEKVGKQMEDHKKSLEKNSEETNKNTEAQKEANRIAQEEERLKSFVSQAKNISEVKVFQTANKGVV